ncbi:glycosyltransferase family 2 protein [Candidatus Stoquefichus massiliensis]|uniref:glycosyltransferase family 2 protein n=1 Tax=Candidatus Stoquefichus massiliensis TaxID=1470350 RepID=UPI0004ACAEF1|nr:glycosyltransferase family 2 protein [Candidatus Stoquefichus massiliensis]
MSKLLTIAIPTYNRLDQLKKSLPFILKQIDYKEIELIIYDNCSTDGTDKYIKNLIMKGENIVYYKNDENLGADRNFLNCFDKASGNYVWLIGDDDYLLSGAINSIISCLKLNPDLLHVNSCILKNDSPITIKNPRFKEDGILVYQNKNEFLEQIGIFITFVSGIIYKNKLVKMIKDKEDYIGTYFLQSHIALKAMTNGKKFIINTKNCIAESGNEKINYDLYYVWFNCFYKLLYETGIKAKFDENTIRTTYINSVNNYVFYFVLQYRVSCRRQNLNWEKRYAFNILKLFPELRNDFIFVLKSPVYILYFYKFLLIIINYLRRLNKLCKID